MFKNLKDKFYKSFGDKYNNVVELARYYISPKKIQTEDDFLHILKDSIEKQNLFIKSSSSLINNILNINSLSSEVDSGSSNNPSKFGEDNFEENITEINKYFKKIKIEEIVEGLTNNAQLHNEEIKSNALGINIKNYFNNINEEQSKSSEKITSYTDEIKNSLNKKNEEEINLFINIINKNRLLSIEKLNIITLNQNNSYQNNLQNHYDFSNSNPSFVGLSIIIDNLSMVFSDQGYNYIEGNEFFSKDLPNDPEKRKDLLKLVISMCNETIQKCILLDNIKVNIKEVTDYILKYDSNDVLENYNEESIKGDNLQSIIEYYFDYYKWSAIITDQEHLKEGEKKDFLFEFFLNISNTKIKQSYDNLLNCVQALTKCCSELQGLKLKLDDCKSKLNTCIDNKKKCKELLKTYNKIKGNLEEYNCFLDKDQLAYIEALREFYFLNLWYKELKLINKYLLNNSKIMFSYINDKIEYINNFIAKAEVIELNLRKQLFLESFEVLIIHLKKDSEKITDDNPNVPYQLKNLATFEQHYLKYSEKNY